MPRSKCGISIFTAVMKGWKCRISRRTPVTLLSLPPEILRLVLLYLYRHNKDWNTDLAFFQASKVNRQFRAIALSIVETEKLNPIKHFLFTRNEWLKFLERYSLTQPPRGYWIIHDLQTSSNPSMSTYQTDRQTHIMVNRLIQGDLARNDLLRRLACLLVGDSMSSTQSSLWGLQRWQKMVILVRKRAELLVYFDLLPFRLLRRLMLGPRSLTATGAKVGRRTVMKYLFQDAEWDLIKTMPPPIEHRMEWAYFRVSEFLIRWVFVQETWPNRHF